MQTIDMLMRIHRSPVVQGWQCPICEAVYAPWVIKCKGCGEGKKPDMSAEQ